jgi:hypothetical protein
VLFYFTTLRAAKVPTGFIYNLNQRNPYSVLDVWRLPTNSGLHQEARAFALEQIIVL